MFVAMVGIVVLFGWAWNIEILKSLLPGLVSMKANTALGFLFSGVTLYLLAVHQSSALTRALRRLLIGSLTLLGIVTLAEYAGGWDFGIDKLLFSDQHLEAFTVYQGRMSLFTALCFSLLGFAMMLVELRRHWVIAQTLALLSLVLPILSLGGYMFGNLTFLTLGNSSTLAVHTAGTFLLVIANLMGLTKSHGLLARWQASFLKISATAVLLVTLLAASAIFFGIETRKQASEDAARAYQDIAQLEDIAADAQQFRQTILNAAQTETITQNEIPILDRASGNYLKAESMATRNALQNSKFNNLKSICYKLNSLTIAIISARHHQAGESTMAIWTTGGGDQQVQQLDSLTHSLIKAKLDQLKTNLDVLNTETSAASLASGIAMSFALLTLLIGGIRLRRELIDRKLAELQAQENQMRFEATFDQAAVGIAHVAPDGQWLRVNDKTCQIVGYSREELLRITFQEITHPDDLDADMRFVQQVLSGEIAHYTMAKRYLHRTGKIVWIRLTVSLTRKKDGQPDYFISVIEDINQAKLADLELKRLHLQANELMGQQVVAQTIMALAHELNQPLNAAASYSEAALRLLKTNATDTNRLTEVLRLNVAEIRQAGEVLKDLLHNTHSDEEDSEPIELNSTLNEAVRMFQRELYEQPPSIQLETAGGEIHVSAKKLVLEKVLMNLLWNAYQASLSGTDEHIPANILIRITPAAETVVVSVIDQGTPLAPTVAEKLFSPFFTTKVHGVGMGLTISRALIESYQGTLWYEPVNGQTAFHFSILPANKPYTTP